MLLVVRTLEKNASRVASFFRFLFIARGNHRTHALRVPHIHMNHETATYPPPPSLFQTTSRMRDNLALSKPLSRRLGLALQNHTFAAIVPKATKMTGRWSSTALPASGMRALRNS